MIQKRTGKKSSRGYIVQAWLVIVLATVYGVALASVQIAFSERIARNKRQETLNRIPELIPGAVRSEALTITGEDGAETRIYKARDAQDDLAGWAVPAGGMGYADRIELLVGLNATMDRVTGLYILDQKETPGLGDHITGEAFRAGFLGKIADADRPLVVVKSGAAADNEIQALSGATVSSESVTRIVNRAIANIKKAALAEKH